MLYRRHTQVLALSLFAGTFAAAGCRQDVNSPPVHPANTDGGTAGATDDLGGGDSDAGPGSADLGGAADLMQNPDLLPPDHDPKLHSAWPTFAATSQNTIQNAEIWTVVWKGDETIGQTVDKFTGWMLGSSYWTTWGLEYGILAGKAMGVLVVPTAPPATFDDNAVETLLNKYLGTSGWPNPNTNTIISFVLDPNTQSSNGGGQGCTDYGGYHSMTQAGVPYLINLQCPDPKTMMPSFDELTIVISHEAGEAASDPDGVQNRGSTLFGGGEVGDMCLALDAKLKSAAGDTYDVSRLYSNAAALSGVVNPCLPDDGPFFFGATVVSTDKTHPSRITVTRTPGGSGTAMFNVETFAYDPSVGPIVFAFTQDFLPPGFSFTPDYLRRLDSSGMVIGGKGEAWAGTTIPMTVTVDATVQKGSYAPMLFAVTTDGRLNIYWPTFVVQ
jgi:hypothetical protein